jgi:hypothetical protein
MGATDELQSYGGGFGLKHPGKDPIQGVAALVPMAIAAHRSEVLGSDPLGGHGRQHCGQSRLNGGCMGPDQGGDLF